MGKVNKVEFTGLDFVKPTEPSQVVEVKTPTLTLKPPQCR